MNSIRNPPAAMRHFLFVIALKIAKMESII